MELERDIIHDDAAIIVDELETFVVFLAFKQLLDDEVWADDHLIRTRKGETVEVVQATREVSETVTGVECLCSSEAHGRENTTALHNVGVLHEEDLVLLHEPQKVIGCLGSLDGVLLYGVELGGDNSKQARGIFLLAVVDEQVVGAVAGDQDGGHVAGS